MTSGPIPKRSEHRRRRNEQSGPPLQRGTGAGTHSWRLYAIAMGIDVPDEADLAEVQSLIAAERDPDLHPLASQWLDALANSGQSHYYEPSDWATARILATILSSALHSGRITAALIERWQSGATELLTTEGARRRVRIELESPTSGDAEHDARVAVLDDARARLRFAE